MFSLSCKFQVTHVTFSQTWTPADTLSQTPRDWSKAVAESSWWAGEEAITHREITWDGGEKNKCLKKSWEVKKFEKMGYSDIDFALINDELEELLQLDFLAAAADEDESREPSPIPRRRHDYRKLLITLFIQK